jgi:aspartyl-tRNA(Asn)/glutamyl-tRNA(Gln) amidotransferase subunit C
MSLTPADVSRIAHLARLEISPAEAEAMRGQLNGFFDIVARMEAVDTRGVEPLYTPLSAVQDVVLRLREDVVSEPATEARRALNQASAPQVEDGLFLVPRVIE